MKNQPVSIEERQQRVDRALECLDECATEWLEARSKGTVPSKVDERFDECLREYRAAANGLEKALKKRDK